MRSFLGGLHRLHRQHGSLLPVRSPVTGSHRSPLPQRWQKTSSSSLGSSTGRTTTGPVTSGFCRTIRERLLLAGPRLSSNRSSMLHPHAQAHHEQTEREKERCPTSQRAKKILSRCLVSLRLSGGQRRPESHRHVRRWQSIHTMIRISRAEGIIFSLAFLSGEEPSRTCEDQRHLLGTVCP